MRRRTVLASTGGLLAALCGCAGIGSSGQPAHTVSVYLGERSAVRDAKVTVEDGEGATLFEREYRLSDGNEAHEDATFPESTDPRAVVVTVDGRRFERPWPEFAGSPEPRCTGENWEGVEVWVEGGPEEPPDVRVTGTCQHVTTE